MTVELQNLTDDDLDGLDDALRAEELRREHLSDLALAQRLADLSDDDLMDLHSRVDDEVEDRTNRMLDAAAAHEIEQGEAREQLGKPERDNLFKLRVARLFKLTRLNAPEAIIAHSLKLVNKVAPEYAI